MVSYGNITYKRDCHIWFTDDLVFENGASTAPMAIDIGNMINIGNLIIPIDVHIFQRGGLAPPTR